MLNATCECVHAIMNVETSKISEMDLWPDFSITDTWLNSTRDKTTQHHQDKTI